MGLEKMIRSSGFVLGMLNTITGCSPQNPKNNISDTSNTEMQGEAPVITSSLSEIAYVDKEFSYILTAEQESNGGELKCDFSATVPSTENNCTFIWTPNNGHYGNSYEIKLKVEDTNGEDNATLEVYVDKWDNAPVINTTALPDATTQTAYNTQISASDPDGDELRYSLADAPTWLTIDSLTGILSGMPASHGTETVVVAVSDGELSANQSYSLLVNSLATLDLNVYDAGGTAGSGDPVEDSCNVEVTLTNSFSDYSETATAVSGIASFSLDETGTYTISVPSTNTDSNCYGGFSQSEWLDVVASSNTSWAYLIPETYQEIVIEQVGNQITEDREGAPWTCDSITDLVKYMIGVKSTSLYGKGWDTPIRDGSEPLEIEDFDGYTYGGIDYDTALEDAVALWDGYLAPTIDINSAGSGGDIFFVQSDDWQTFTMLYTTGVISQVEIMYGTAESYNAAVGKIAREMGSVFFKDTDVEGFLMNSSESTNHPHNLELHSALIYNNIGPTSPKGNRIDLYNGYLE